MNSPARLRSATFSIFVFMTLALTFFTRPAAALIVNFETVPQLPIGPSTSPGADRLKLSMTTDKSPFRSISTDLFISQLRSARFITVVDDRCRLRRVPVHFVEPTNPDPYLTA